MLELFRDFLVAYQAKDWPVVARLGDRLLAAGFVEPDPQEHGMVAGYLASCYRHLGNLSRAQELICHSRKQAPVGSRTAAYVLVEGVTIHAMRGAFSEAKDWAQDFIEEAGHWATPDGMRWLGLVHHNLAYVYRMLRDNHTALEHAKTSSEAFERAGDGPMTRYLAVLQAQILCDMGACDEAHTILASIDESELPPERVPDLLYVQGLCAYLSGDLSGSLELVCRAMARTLHYPKVRFMDAMVNALIGHILKKLGHAVEGELFIQGAIDKCSRHGRVDLLDQIGKLGG